MLTLHESLLDIEDVEKSTEDITKVPSFEQWRKAHKNDIKRRTSCDWHLASLSDSMAVKDKSGQELYPIAYWYGNHTSWGTTYDIHVGFSKSRICSTGTTVSVGVRGLSRVWDSKSAWKATDEALYYLTANEYMTQRIYDALIEYMDKIFGKRNEYYNNIPVEFFKKKRNLI